MITVMVITDSIKNNEKIAASIIGASTRSVGDRAYGYMLLDIPGGPENLAKAIRFLSSVPDVTVQVEAEYNAEEAEEK